MTFRDRMDRLFDELGGRDWGGQERWAHRTWSPAVDIYETKENITLKADLPEVSKGAVDVSVEGGTLTIRGERKREREVVEQDYHRRERSFGSFSRSFTLPTNIDPAKIEATFSGGVLTVILPKKEESKPKQVRVKMEGEGK